MGRNKVAQLETPCRQLRDAIRANTVYAHATEGFPLVSIIGSPGDDSRVDGVCARDEVFIYERCLLPQILRASRDERSHGVDVTRDFQNTGSNRGEQRFDGSDNAM